MNDMKVPGTGDRDHQPSGTAPTPGALRTGVAIMSSKPKTIGSRMDPGVLATNCLRILAMDDWPSHSGSLRRTKFVRSWFRMEAPA